MPMTMNELQKALRGLRLSGMSATLEARALQVASHEYDFLEAIYWLVQDELDRRRSRLLDRRYTGSGLTERASLTTLDWSYNPKLPKRDVLERTIAEYGVDPKQVYLAGHSMGAGGGWYLAGKYPGRFVAIGLLSGPLDLSQAYTNEFVP